mmetsp:Transcript_24409/g.67851  ORF Transcript_24409/g.67851 Transcript_24409/m.67851 type:complete len:387 (-) Transcript_24409:457-1617(-)
MGAGSQAPQDCCRGDPHNPEASQQAGHADAGACNPGHPVRLPGAAGGGVAGARFCAAGGVAALGGRRGRGADGGRADGCRRSLCGAQLRDGAEEAREAAEEGACAAAPRPDFPTGGKGGAGFPPRAAAGATAGRGTPDNFQQGPPLQGEQPPPPDSAQGRILLPGPRCHRPRPACSCVGSQAGAGGPPGRGAHLPEQQRPAGAAPGGALGRRLPRPLCSKPWLRVAGGVPPVTGLVLGPQPGPSEQEAPTGLPGVQAGMGARGRRRVGWPAADVAGVATPADRRAASRPRAQHALPGRARSRRRGAPPGAPQRRERELAQAAGGLQLVAAAAVRWQAIAAAGPAATDRGAHQRRPLDRRPRDLSGWGGGGDRGQWPYPLLLPAPPC